MVVSFVILVCANMNAQSRCHILLGNLFALSQRLETFCNFYHEISPQLLTVDTWHTLEKFQTALREKEALEYEALFQAVFTMARELP